MTKKATFPKLSAVADTISGAKARQNPQETIAHYELIAEHLWLPTEVQQLADNLFVDVKRKTTAWASLSGDYGFGKTSATITLWKYAKQNDFLAIPPLSCTGFDELAYAVVALAEAQMPKAKTKIRALFKEVWAEGIEQTAKRDAIKYELESKKMRRVLEDKLNAGQLTLDGQCHRFVEFLSRLGELATNWSNGLIVILDELQQLLGPLDARAIIQFREFVWGMRTERTNCGIVVSLDAMLEARLARWAGDILHRIREQSPALQMSTIYTREFPVWLWKNLTTQNGSAPLLNKEALTEDVLTSLGQFVERPDLANGPRTVADVFSRASEHFEIKKEPYEVSDMVEDIRNGRFRYFGETAPVQNLLTQLLKEEWIVEDQARLLTVSTLAAFPLGCPNEIWEKQVPSAKERARVREDLFNPLLVELSGGLALEKLQQVRRSSMNWERILARSWETLPAFDALAAHTPNYIQRIFIPVLFPQNAANKNNWTRLTDETSVALTGWHRYKGTFSDDFPEREVAIWVGEDEPTKWLQDADLCLALICDKQPNAQAESRLEEHNETVRIILRLPILKALVEYLPDELERCRKYIQPEPFNLAIILHAVHELEAVIGNLYGDTENAEYTESFNEEKELMQARSFVRMTIEFLLRESLQGSIQIGKYKTKQHGKELLHALFVKACRHQFGNYETFIRAPKWRENLKIYRDCLENVKLNQAQRQARETIIGSKADLLDSLFEQKSTAAGDSFLRSFGALIEVDGTPENFSILMSLHPAELSLLNYLKRIKAKHRIGFEAATEFLGHQGYLKSETEEIVHLLSVRELITVDEKNTLAVVQNAEAARQELITRIAEIRLELKAFGANNLPDKSLEKLPLVKLQSIAKQFEDQLQEKLSEQITHLKIEADKIRSAIGTVSACFIESDASGTEISQHLSGIAENLLKVKDSLIKGLRKESERTTAELKKADFNRKDWTRQWQIRRELFFVGINRLHSRVEQFTERFDSFKKWSALNQQLNSTRFLCDKVAEREPEYRLMLNQLIDKWRERFATETWATMFDAESFSTEISIIQAKVQNLIFSLSQTFNHELNIFQNEFGVLLPALETPTFEDSEAHENSIAQRFRDLYVWVLNGLSQNIEKCQYRKESGERWSAPASANWKELNEQVNRLVENCSRNPDFNAVKSCAEKTAKLVSGFAVQPLLNDGEIESTNFTNPASPPDFEKLKRQFLAGLITIKIKPNKK